jgi:hypothetical protein
MDDDCGLLGRLSADDIGRAVRLMPDAQTATPGETATAVIEVPELGRVRITAVLKRNPRWTSYRFWTPVRAEAASRSPLG